MRMRLVLGAAFLMIIVVAGLVYWLAWQRRPDYFVVQQELNLYPFGSLEGFLRSDRDVPMPAQVNDLTEAATRASELLRSARTLRETESQLTAESQRVEREMTEVSAELEENRASRIEEFRRLEIGPLEQSRAAIVERLSGVEARLNPDENRYDPLRAVVAGIRVELAEHDLHMALKRADIADRVVREYGQFASPEDVKRWRDLDAQAAAVRDGLTNAGRDRADLRRATLDLLDELRAERVSRVGFWDFVYFSIGVSTTTTFGDIVPNHTLTRSIVTIQLLLSILIVGVFVNSLSEDLSRSKRPPNLAMESSSRGQS
jgi:hypothetical protein